MTQFFPSKFTINSALELVADAFTADIPETTIFRSASVADRVTLKSGYESAQIAAIINGVIDEYELRITPDNIDISIAGRDPSAAILDSYFERTYTRERAATQPNAGFIEIAPSLPATDVLNAVTVTKLSAKQIAEDAVTSVGLTLQWGVRDYQIQAPTYRASGRIIDILRRLVEPWSLVEPYRVDIYLQGSSVILKHRQEPGSVLQADYTFEIADTRRKAVRVRKRRFKKIGKVTLHGQKVPEGLSTTPTEDGGLLFVAGTQTIILENDAFDEGGHLIQKTVTEETLRMPDRIPIKTIKSVYTKGEGGLFTLQTRETIDYDVEDSIYDFSGPINQPKQRSQSIRKEAIDPEDDVFKDFATERTVYLYDDMNFMKGQTTLKRVFNSDENAMVDSELSIETIRDIGPLIAERIVELYNFDLEDKKWIINRRDSTIAGGHRPGGPGRGGSLAGLANQGGATAFKTLELIETLSSDLDAVPVEYSNENLTLADLQFIMNLFRNTIGLYEYELHFDGPAMSWFHRGQSVKVVKVFAEDGITEIDIPPCIIASIETTYDESTERATYMQLIKAFGAKVG